MHQLLLYDTEKKWKKIKNIQLKAEQETTYQQGNHSHSKGIFRTLHRNCCFCLPRATRFIWLHNTNLKFINSVRATLLIRAQILILSLLVDLLITQGWNNLIKWLGNLTKMDINALLPEWTSRDKMEEKEMNKESICSATKHVDHSQLD